MTICVDNLPTVVHMMVKKWNWWLWSCAITLPWHTVTIQVRK